MAPRLHVCLCVCACTALLLFVSVPSAALVFSCSGPRLLCSLFANLHLPPGLPSYRYLCFFYVPLSVYLSLSLSVALFPPSWVSLSRSQADSLPLSHSVFIIYLSTYLTAFRSLFQSLFLSLSFSLSGELSEFCCCMLIFLSLHLSISLLICLFLYFFTHPLLFLLFLMIILFL